MEKHETPYKVPSSKGGFLSAEPVQFCLRYKPPTIALVYEIIRKQKDQSPNSNATGDTTLLSNNTKRKRHIHEIKVDNLNRNSDLEKLCDVLFEREYIYLDPKTISRLQVINLLQKL